ncbi:MAG: hypothetical protein JKY19_04675 [Alcanivoracaceae bacterium]|nr:hypothetical protein [Alcanivoracaceae bacterium]
MFSNSATELEPFSVGLSDDIGACAELRFKAYNREQGLDQNDFIFPLLPPGVYVPEHCWSVNVADVDGTTEDVNSIFASHLKMNDWLIGNNTNPIYHLESSSGWMQMDFADEQGQPGRLSGVGINGGIQTIIGKPVLGFVAQKYINGTLNDSNGNGVLANYGLITMNKNIKKIISSAPLPKK